jgi:two-component system, chemotaxis family, chemotaxis protein CheY
MGNILVVEDSKPIRCMLKNILIGAGHVVVEACDGKEGLDIAASSSFDLIVTDVNMPEMNGLELAKHLRQTPDYKFTPIVILTTESSDEFKVKGMEAGATAWLTKPFSPNKLIEVVDKVAGLW